MSNDAHRHVTVLKQLKAQRKRGELGLRDYYQRLLRLLADVLSSLQNEDIGDDDVKRQVPLILVFLEEQIKKYAGRNH
ncbi:MAG: hypothetical protein GXO54_03575 [Chloroflexi bacterium]|nr:hypothetical protein [Chloroflexota bacterium]